MCGRVRAQRSKPGDIMAFWTKHGLASGLWGFGNGHQYNARLESLATIWKNYQFGILRADCFWEKDTKFVSCQDNSLNIGVIYKNSEFAVITTQADEEVKKVHHRMPLLIPTNKIDSFLDGREDLILLPKVRIVPEEKLIIAA